MRVCLKVPDFSINCLVNLINFNFTYPAVMIKVDNKVIDNINRIYLNEYYILLFIHLVSEMSEELDLLGTNDRRTGLISYKL